MITTDQLQADLNKLHDALEAFAFTFNTLAIHQRDVEAADSEN